MLRDYKILMCCYFWLCLGSVGGQDIHYSQFFNSPLNLNPGLTGIYNGDVRVQANYRSQWANVPVDYVSGAIGIDFKRKPNAKNNFLGYGLLLNFDQAGDLNLGWTGGNAFASYSLKVGQHNYITPGVTLGYYSRNYNANNAITTSQWTGKGIDPATSPELLGQDNIGFVDIGIGANFRRQKSHRQRVG